METTIVNKVKLNQKLVTLDLSKFIPKDQIVELDIKEFLFQELLLKEKDFRNYLSEYNWSKFEGKYLGVYCSTDALIAPWAWMLITSEAKPFAIDVYLGDSKSVKHQISLHNLRNHDWSVYQDKFVMLKGCGNESLDDSFYLLATNKLMPYSKKIMYGEACSNVPIWKSK